jgi:hypothetical protein
VARSCSRWRQPSWYTSSCRPIPSCATWASTASKTSAAPSRSFSSSPQICRQHFRP